MKTLKKPSNAFLIYNATSINVQRTEIPINHEGHKFKFIKSFFDITWLLRLAEFRRPENLTYQTFSLTAKKKSSKASCCSKKQKHSQSQTNARRYDPTSKKGNRPQCNCCLCGYEPPPVRRTDQSTMKECYSTGPPNTEEEPSKPERKSAVSDQKIEKPEKSEQKIEKAERKPAPMPPKLLAEDAPVNNESIQTTLKWNCKCNRMRGPPPLGPPLMSRPKLAPPPPDLSDKECQVKCTAAIERLQQEIERLEEIIQFGEPGKTTTTQTHKHKRTQQTHSACPAFESEYSEYSTPRPKSKSRGCGGKKAQKKESRNSIKQSQSKKCFSFKKKGGKKRAKENASAVSIRSDDTSHCRSSGYYDETDDSGKGRRRHSKRLKDDRSREMMCICGSYAATPAPTPTKCICGSHPAAAGPSNMMQPDPSSLMQPGSLNMLQPVLAGSSNMMQPGDSESFDCRVQVRRQIRLMEDIIDELEMQRRDVSDLKVMLEGCISLIQTGTGGDYPEYYDDNARYGTAPKRSSIQYGTNAPMRLMNGCPRNINSAPNAGGGGMDFEYPEFGGQTRRRPPCAQYQNDRVQSSSSQHDTCLGSNTIDSAILNRYFR